MNKYFRLLPLILILLCPPMWALAASNASRAEKQIRQKFAVVMPRFEVQSVKTSPIFGLYEVQMLNGPLLLSTASADYFISGDVFATASGVAENVSEMSRKQQRVSQIEAFNPDELIVFSPEGKTKRWVAVFTDIKCGYCRKFHGDVPELNKMGIEVRYFAFPIFDGSRDQMISAVCSDDPRKALTTLKTGGSIPSKTCGNQSIDAQTALARQFSLSGTPGIVLDDGTLVKGYVPPAQLGRQLGL